MIFDLGLLRRELGYYTGAIFEVLDPALGVPLGGGGRYDELLGRFGRPLPAVGWTLEVERVHDALVRERSMMPARSPSRAARCSRRRSTSSTPSGSTPPPCAPTTASCSSRTEGLVTMRPSDVPTYVEAGAADVGITGKDVLREQPEREVVELLDLGFGGTTMVFATEDGPDPAAEALRRLGVMRIATKYPKSRPALLRRRPAVQVEIVEVKGSVELAPLTGLVEGIVDLTQTGTTLRENGLVVREEIYHSTARLIANPVAYRTKAAGDRRRSWSACVPVERLPADRGGRARPSPGAGIASADAVARGDRRRAGAAGTPRSSSSRRGSATTGGAAP